MGKKKNAEKMGKKRRLTVEEKISDSERILLKRMQILNNIQPKTTTTAKAASMAWATGKSKLKYDSYYSSSSDSSDSGRSSDETDSSDSGRSSDENENENESDEEALHTENAKVDIISSDEDEDQNEYHNTKVVPKRLFSRSRQRSITSQLFDDSLEASTESGFIMNDEKRKASRRLERRKILRSEGNNKKQPATTSTKKIKRERSIATRLMHKSTAAEVVLNSL